MLSYATIDTDFTFKEDIKKKLQGYEFTVEEINDSGNELIIKINTDDEETLNNFVNERLHKILGIKRVKMVVID